MAPTPQPPLDLKIPSSSATVSVRIINTTSYINNIPYSSLMTPTFPNFTSLNCPCFSFLIEHPTTNRSLLFDLGIRTDWEESLPPPIVKHTKSLGAKVLVEKGVREQLEEHGIPGSSIEAIIWSHWHWDHIGDASTFPPSTAVIVGPGFSSAFIPAYPTNPESPILESDLAGRELREISFDTTGLKIGNFGAFDYFGDGSFYLLDSPGHAIGHMCGLARVKKGTEEEGDHFIFMGGDACHHGGEFRPSKYLPVPDSITPHPFHNNQTSISACPGALFEKVLRDGDATKPIFTIPDERPIHFDAQETRVSVEKVMEADGNDTVFVVIAHDASLLDVLDFFPERADGFFEKGWVGEGRWKFLKDFEGDVEGL